jgi:hypothetical protein
MEFGTRNRRQGKFEDEADCARSPDVEELRVAIWDFAILLFTKEMADT